MWNLNWQNHRSREQKGVYQGFGCGGEGEVVVKGNKVLCRICKFWRSANVA